jgi:hypothetical protein
MQWIGVTGLDGCEKGIFVKDLDEAHGLLTVSNAICRPAWDTHIGKE